MENIEKVRHSLSHILAKAVKELYPEAALGMGPATENGFYYDFDRIKIGEDDLLKIEERMREIIKEDISFVKKKKNKEEVLEIFKNEPYKLEIIEDIEKEDGNKNFTVYESGNFIDLCEGPHVKRSKEIPLKSFKLERIAGAYFKGLEKRPMLKRIYGLAFASEDELKTYLKNREEAAERDHRKWGARLDLFCFSDLVGPGFPLFTPRGTIVISELKKKIEEICENYGFQKVLTPHLAKIELYEKSGHAKKFSEELFHVSSENKHEFAIRPVLCPHQTQIYASKIRSYRDLPIRYMESEKQYRAEKPGEVKGLSRVYGITIEDGHCFCTTDQVKDEIKGIIAIIKDFYSLFDLWGNHRTCLSLRDYSHPENYIGEKEDWDLCEKILGEVAEEMDLDAERQEGEAAIYGPKIDFMFKDAMDNEIQIPTVQIDFATPKRFDLTYIDENGKEQTPIMVHRAVLGSYERFIALLLEHFNGALPFWLSPEQVRIIPVSEKFSDYAEKLCQALKKEKIRVTIDREGETLSKKIRNGEIQKIPYLLVVGEKEKKASSASVRYNGNDEGAVSFSNLIERIKKEKEL